MGCELYADRHTSMITEGMEAYISETTGKKVTNLTRQDMEDNLATIIKKAKKTDIAILTGGDPLMATTHKIFFSEAKRHGVKVMALHGNSIITTAMGESGLDFYRFGKTCTIPRWTEKYKPVSFYETIRANDTIKAHTILLLDYDSEKMRTIPLADAISTLRAAEANYGNGIVKDERKILVLNNLSREYQRKMHVTIREAENLGNEGMNVIVLYSDLTDIEKETMEAMVGAK